MVEFWNGTEGNNILWNGSIVDQNGSDLYGMVVISVQKGKEWHIPDTKSYSAGDKDWSHG